MPSEKTHANVVIRQRVAEGKVVRAQQMRRAMTPEEAKLWRQLRDSRLGLPFRRQQVIDGFIVDFYCHAAALVVEVDSPMHDKAYDAERDQILARRGLLVLRFTNKQVNDFMPAVLSTIRQTILKRTTEMSEPVPCQQPSL